MRCNSWLLGIALLGGAVSQSQAAVQYSTSLATWQAEVGPNFQTTTYGSDGSSVSSVTLGDGSQSGLTLDISPNSTIDTVPTSWSTWCCGYTGQVLYPGVDSVTFTVAPGQQTTGIGFYAEPNQFQTFLITLDAANGSSVLTQQVAGQSGAMFFGFSAPNGVVRSFTVSSSNSFAVGDFYAEAAVPEASTWAMMLFGLAGLGFAGYRRGRTPRAALA